MSLNIINDETVKNLKYIKGKLYWTKTVTSRAVIGTIAGHLHRTGYRHIRVDNKSYCAHRMVWYIFNKENPTKQIDHINGDKDDNRIENLRLVNCRENKQNLKRHRDGMLVGASLYKRDGSWRSSIYYDGKCRHIGYYNTQEEAHNAYMKKLEEIK